MIEAIETEAEAGFDFSALQSLDSTTDVVGSPDGTLKIIPTKFPLPFGTRLLEPLTDERTRVFRPPRDLSELRQTLYRCLEYFLEEPGERSGLLWCHPSLVDRAEEVPGSEFLQFSRFTLQETNHTLEDVFQDASGVPPEDVNDATPGEYLFRACLAAAVGTDSSSLPLERISPGTDDLYVPTAELAGELGPVEEFYLRSIGVETPSLFAELDEDARANVQLLREAAALDEHPEELSERFETLQTIRALDEAVRTTLFRTAFRSLCNRGYDPDIESLAPSHVDREFLDNLRESYRAVVGDDQEFSVQTPLENGPCLVPYLGLLGADVPRRELAAQLSFARTQIASQARGFDDGSGFSEDIRDETVARWGRFFVELGELALVHSVGVLNGVADTDSWVETLLPLVEHDITSQGKELGFTYFEALNEARSQIHRQRELAERVRELNTLEIDIRNIQAFLDEWASFVTDTYPQRAEPSPETSTLVDVYDAFVDELVDSYDEIVASEEHEHISNLVTSAEANNGVTVLVVIDSFGYTDYQFIRNLDPDFDMDPERTGVVYSNVPSYTPSAMSTLLTGRPARETGIYGWDPASDGQIYHMKLPLTPEDVPSSSAPERDPLSYTLIQRSSLSDSGLTTVVKEASDVSLKNVTISQKEEIMDDVRTGFAEAVGSELKSRLKTLTSDHIPDHARKHQDDVFVLYLQEFDSLLHKRLPIENFESYYKHLSLFLQRFVDDLQREITDAYDTLATGAYTDEDVSIVVSADHGKLTKYERQDIIEPGNKAHEFSNRTLEDAVSLRPAHRINFNSLELSTPHGESKPFLAFCDEHPTVPYDRIRSYLRDAEPDSGSDSSEAADTADTGVETVSDDVLERAVSREGFKNNSSKFMFGFVEEDPSDVEEQLADIPGVDSFTPPPGAMFTAPDVGVVSRYTPKHNSTEHGHHGGTSLSEMVGVRLEYEGRL